MNKLTNVSNVMIKWLDDNMMKANPNKFQLIVFDPKNQFAGSVHINDSVIQSQACVKSLGVNFDMKLNFNEHINEICKKAFMSMVRNILL